ncbi:MAG: thioredoxin domain-containing protein [Hymenobacteraceae bacterium]|nr:thioredoxin domain-containing protein [Hymenobacteraceae bacterium]MDX5397026.1 thioredoxin domain-containing protein [Hymenobacteraceae bacterium]MDX5513100.1 thioredoxin domain-containing protein [Hymenobacteraceae bacterium]
MTKAAKHTNRLITETSPYLLQHAHNPVEWYPWGEEALQLAKEQDKPIIVSIGYAACHWCHVMEHESFEQPEVAEVMNDHFICIKVDREERPDVDQVYMDALQAMGLQGGWPLNVFLTPEAKPFYGGTYFPPKHWVKLLQNIAEAYQKNRQELDQSAEQFVQHLNTSDLRKYGLTQDNTTVSEADFQTIFKNLSEKFDRVLGGMDGAPKFPMPAVYQFLLRAWQHLQKPEALDQLNLTLREMAWGGIYDQIGGGFARYSVDAEWLVPHFEKMLYDNGQLVSLYTQAYQATKEPLYKQVVHETIEWVSRELTHPDGGFYSSLDADSEGVEGKFYVFTKKELDYFLKDDAELAAAYYNATEAGNWEHGLNILHRRQTDEAFATKHNLTVEQLQDKVADWKHTLLHHRNLRVHPGLDDKILTSWNAMMLTGLCDAYLAFGEPRFLEMALQNGRFLTENLKKGEKLFHNFKNDQVTINGFLEDYAWMIKGCLALYNVTFEEEWLQQAKQLTAYVQQNFWDETEGLFYFTDQNSEKLIARKKEIFDNVIPASNSIMAENLHKLSVLLDKPRYLQQSADMLAKVKDLVLQEPRHLANWASLYYSLLIPVAEVAIAGPDARQKRLELGQYFLPNAVVAGTETESTLPLLENRTALNGQTTFYVCFNKTCRLPVDTVAEALEQLQQAGV